MIRNIAAHLRKILLLSFFFFLLIIKRGGGGGKIKISLMKALHHGPKKYKHNSIKATIID